MHKSFAFAPRIIHADTVEHRRGFGNVCSDLAGDSDYTVVLIVGIRKELIPIRLI